MYALCSSASRCPNEDKMCVYKLRMQSAITQRLRSHLLCINIFNIKIVIYNGLIKCWDNLLRRINKLFAEHEDARGRLG